MIFTRKVIPNNNDLKVVELITSPYTWA